MSMVTADIKGYDYVPFENIKSINDLEKYIDKPTVIEYDTLSPVEFDKLPYKDKFRVVFLGFATDTPKQLFDHYNRDGKAVERGRTEKVAEEVCAIGKKNKAECEKLGYKFFDCKTSELPIAGEVWEYLFNEKREIDLGKKTRFDT